MLLTHFISQHSYEGYVVPQTQGGEINKNGQPKLPNQNTSNNKVNNIESYQHLGVENRIQNIDKYSINVRLSDTFLESIIKRKDGTNNNELSFINNE